MDREIWWGEEVDSRSFTRKLVVEMQQAAARNQIDPHLVTIWWNPNDWNIRAVIKPDEGGITKLSLSFLARWQVVLEFDDDLLLRLTDDNIAKVQNDVADSFLKLFYETEEERERLYESERSGSTVARLQSG